MKWIRQFEGPFLVTKVPSSVSAKIQRTAKARPKVVHIDKLKAYYGDPPKSWLPKNNENSEGKVSEESICQSPHPGAASLVDPTLVFSEAAADALSL